MNRPWFRFYDRHVPKSLDYPEIPVYELLDESARRHPDGTLSIFFGKKITYGRMKELTDRFAHSLMSLGAGPGKKVAILLPNSPAFLIAYYGILKTGAAAVPLNPLYTPHELEYHISDSGAEILITIPMFLEKVLSLPEKTPLRKIIYAYIADFLPFHLGMVQKLREFPAVRKARKSSRADFYNMSDMLRNPVPSDFKPAKVNPGDMAVMIYSGGTTGIAKGIMLSHYAIVANAHMIKVWGDLNPEERMMAVLPFFHGYGMNVTMNAPILAGMPIIMLPRFSARQTAKAIHKYRPTLTAAVPTMLVALSSLDDIDRYDFSSLKAVWVGAAPLTRAIKENFEKKTGGRAVEGYGLTEAVTAIMANPYRGMHKVGSIGLPFPDVDAKIVSIDTGEDLPPGEKGEIVLKTPTVMLGYHNMPEETAETLKDGWLYTGDIGYMDEDGYFYITDRKKDLIIVGGFNVFPREIDELIYRHPKVKEGITVGVPDEFLGERIKVFIVLKEGESATEEEFIEYFRQHLVKYKVPSEVEFRKELPKSAIGKILRRVLREEEIKKRQKGNA